MTADSQFKVPIDTQLAIFTEHLKDPENERTIFSGIFGIGKSYFIDKFFKLKEDNYLAIKLAPVNYSISSNEDIFNLIKYDILYELIINHKLELESEVIRRHIAYGTVLSSNTGALLEDFLSVAPLLNKSLGGAEGLNNPYAFISFLKKVIPQIEKIEKQRKDANLNQRVLDYIKRLEQSAIFESDFITGFIVDSLDRLANKEGQGKLKKVLIIDDLDRIDPEHIFRLFNIFSSHLNYGKSNTNKFGFDKIIFVCDIENIRNIFSARYGVSTDFSGYIDKFYSTEIFHFDNSAEVAAFTNTLIKSINFISSHDLIKECFIGNNSLLNILIKQLVLSGSLNMRRIDYTFDNNFTLKEKDITIIGSETRFQNWKLPAIIALEILAWIYGDVAALETALAKTASFEKSRVHSGAVDLNIKLAGYFIPIIDAAQHKFDEQDSGKDLQLGGQTIKYKLTCYRRFNDRDFYFAEIINKADIEEVNLFETIKQALKILDRSGYFKKS